MWRSARAIAWSELLSAGFGNPLVVDALKFYDTFLGELLPHDFKPLGRRTVTRFLCESSAGKQ